MYMHVKACGNKWNLLYMYVMPSHFIVTCSRIYVPQNHGTRFLYLQKHPPTLHLHNKKYNNPGVFPLHNCYTDVCVHGSKVSSVPTVHVPPQSLLSSAERLKSLLNSKLRHFCPKRKKHSMPISLGSLQIRHTKPSTETERALVCT